MANGVQLATAYISLNVNTKDIKGQVESAFLGLGVQGRATGAILGKNIASGIRSHMSGSSLSMSIFNPMEIAGVRWAVKAGTAIGSALKRALIGAVGGLGLGAIFGVGGILTAGLDRLKTLQQSTVQLQLKLSPEEIRKVQNDIKEVVRGTPIPLDQAMQAVPRAIAAGLRGQNLQQYIKDIADLTASTGGQAGFEQLAIILEHVRGNGKLAGDELNQLIQAGVDIKSILKETFGWDDKTLQKNLAKGKVGINEIQKAVQNVYGRNGGLARGMGETLEGALGNLKASVSRLGANFIAAIMGKKADEDPLKDYALAVGRITENLDKLGAWVDEHNEDIHGFFKGIGDAANWVGDKLSKLPGFFTKVKDVGVSVADWVSRAWTNIGTKFDDVKTKVTDTVGSIKTKISDMFSDLETKFTSIFGPNGWFATQFKRLGELVDKVREVLGLGPATANAAGGTTPFNAGPQAPTAATPGGGGLTGRVGAAGVPSSGSLQTQQKNPWTSEWDVLGKGGASKPAAKPSGVIKSAGTPYGLDPLADTGGYGNPAGEKMFPPWVLQLGAKYGVKPSTYPNHQVGSGLNQGIDWVGSVDQMDAFARWLVSTKPPGLKQVIWQNPNTQFRVGSVDNKPVGPDLADTTDPGYYSRGKNDWADHQNHVHTAWSENLDLSQFATGGSVFGAGSATSDSIPAMLSNGEHVLTAADVKAMGGQKGVYAFRAALQKGLIPGFAPGGAVDPNQVQDLNNQLYDLRSAQDLAQKQLDELPEDATAVQRLQAETQLSQATRALQQATADFPIIMSGGTPPDRSLQNNVLDTTDSARLALAQLDDLRQRVASGEDIKPSQIYSAESQANVAQRNRQQAIDALNQQNKPISFIDEFQRTAGFVPTAAGNTGVAGTSALSSVIGMGNEFVGGLIDTGASLLQTAAQAGITAGTMGAGAAAGPASGAAASYGIQLGASVLKRASSFGFQLASIGADSLIAQLFPFGAPRWIGYDYTGFMPQLGIQQAALTTIEKMGNQEIQKRFGQGFDVPPLNPQSPEAPIASPDAPAGPAPIGGMVGPQNPVPDTGNIDLAPWLRNSPGGGGGSWARGGAISIYDQGGVLKPGDLALNASRRPERILTDKQWDALSKIQPVGQQPLVKIDTIYGMSPEDVANQITSKQQLAMMRYAGRP